MSELDIITVGLFAPDTAPRIEKVPLRAIPERTMDEFGNEGEQKESQNDEDHLDFLPR
jgi:hypothetical protein